MSNKFKKGDTLTIIYQSPIVKYFNLDVGDSITVIKSKGKFIKIRPIDHEDGIGMWDLRKNYEHTCEYQSQKLKLRV